MKKTERRTLVARDVETRSDNGALQLTGYAALFNIPSQPLPFIETILPGAFRKTLSESPDVRFMPLDHDGLPLARTKNGTLTLSEDEVGLRFTAQLPDTPEARALWTAVDRKDVDQMSFTFRAIRQKWSPDRSARSLTEVSISNCDISPVVFPAYLPTSVEARALMTKAQETLETLNGIAPHKEGRSESIAALQSAFDMARTGLAQLLALEAGELAAGVDESWSLDYLMDSINSLVAWFNNEDWECDQVMTLADSTEADIPVEASSISLRLAQARAFAAK